PATQSALIATFLASFAAGLVSWVLARLRQSPTTLYTLPGVLPLLPGLPIYSGMLALSQNRSNDGILQLITATFLGGAIAAGVALSNTVLAQVWRLSLLGRAKKQP
ncbi:MAG: Threonine/Serine exporter, ThrE, partial [Chloroflexi bacterium]|nr:Threonine/Serine exporter, ThrE [Chloroflexota bacterium]